MRGDVIPTAVMPQAGRGGGSNIRLPPNPNPNYHPCPQHDYRSEWHHSVHSVQESGLRIIGILDRYYTTPD